MGKLENATVAITVSCYAEVDSSDHLRPFSASECKLLNHVKTQAPYAFITAIWSILVGTIPSGRGSLNNGICILLGFLASVFSTTLLAAAPLNKTGRFDVVTELYILITKNEYLLKLKADAKKVYETGETLVSPKEADETTKTTNDVTKHLLGDEELASSNDGAGDDAEAVEVTEMMANPHASSISAISDVGPEDPLPEESADKNPRAEFTSSVLSA